MIAASTSAHASVDYAIRLRLAPTELDDAWELHRTLRQYGGRESGPGCFVFSNEEGWLMAIEALCDRFGAAYFDAYAATGAPST